MESTRWQHAINSPLAIPGRLSLSRRALLRSAGLGLTGAGAAALFGCGDDDKADPPSGSGADGPPEATSIRIVRDYAICAAAQYVAEEYLKEEGFTDVQYVATSRLSEINALISRGAIDMSLNFAAPLALAIDGDQAIVVLGGVHIGCFEVWAQDNISTIADLRGKTIGLGQSSPVEGDYIFMSSLLSFVGIDPDRSLIAKSRDQILGMYSRGELDAVLVYPPMSQQLRTLNVGHLILSSMTDSPYSSYECCLVAANRGWVNAHPVAAKRALRAILRGADLCARKPETVAKYLFDHAFVSTYEYALEAMQSLPYEVWRRFDPEDSLRFYALRLNETGVIKSTPNEVIARGSDWRIFNELREEMAFAPGFEPPSGAFAFGCEIDGRAKALQATGAPVTRTRGEGL